MGTGCGIIRKGALSVFVSHLFCCKLKPSEVVVVSFSLNPENDQVPEATTRVQLKHTQARTRAAFGDFRGGSSHNLSRRRSWGGEITAAAEQESSPDGVCQHESALLCRVQETSKKYFNLSVAIVRAHWRVGPDVGGTLLQLKIWRKSLPPLGRCCREKKPSAAC